MEANTPDTDSGKKHSRGKAGCAMALSLILPCLLYAAIVVSAGDRLFPCYKIPPGREHRAALAIRDDVIPFFKWGTLLFTKRHLRKFYGASWYFTQARRGDGEAEFVAALTEALEHYPAVDLYLLAHTNKYITWVEPLPETLRRRLRFVYNTGCHNKGQGEDWLALGADAYIGHPGESQSPFFYFFLLRHWLHGATLAEAMETGNRGMETKFRQVERFSGGRYDAGQALRESVASCLGNDRLRLEDLP
ncbi:MAG: hypothetical protein BWX80_00590 [Candidatus Hydrogenedentes bacterium ADurb.Bin101]|nr:MAG: hypothetical protein BWX80_00590 [Candidatus Hydrogenedentes bacterium ADurb.Bin101]